MAEAQQDLDLVRGEVRQILGGSPAWNSLDEGKRRAFAQNMVKVAHFLARDPGWLDVPDAPGTRALVEGQAQSKDPIDDLKSRLAQKPGQVGAEFQAGALRQGVSEFGNLVKTVDFPEFVSGLIHGVFQAIVDASIQQMEAYGELLAATAKTVGQFAQDHISDDQAREQIATRYPSLVRVERSGQGTRLAPQEGADDLSGLQQMTGGRDRISLDEPESEQKLVQSAKLEMARQRQKMMALMVMLGINRIIVTNGRINAKVIFDVEASDYAKRKASAGLTDTAESESGGVATAVFPWGGAGGYSKSSHKTTVRSSIDDNSESRAQMKAQLTGEVNVNFKSETLPPERMLDSLQYEQFNYMSQGGGAPGAPGAAGAAAPTAGHAPAPTPERRAP